MTLSLSLGLLVWPAISTAQRRPPRKRDPAPTYVDPSKLPEAPHVEEPIISVVDGGLTADEAAKRVVATSYTVTASSKTAAAAAARTEQASYGYVPSLLLTASYTRLSPLTPPLSSDTNIPVTDAPAGTINPPTVSAAPVRFPIVLDRFLLQATVSVPVSDYFLKVHRTEAAASASEEAARFDTTTARATAAIAARQAYYAWLRALGAASIAEQTLDVAEAHLNDAKVRYGAGAVAAADVLRAEAAVAAAELAVQQAKAGVATAEWDLRTLMHAPEEEELKPGESLSATLPPLDTKVRAMLTEAASSRPEMKSLKRNAEAARKRASAARANRLPSLAAIGDVTYANPNPRKFPQTAQWFPSWSVGAQLTWSPKDFLAAGPAGDEEAAKAAELEATLQAQRNAVSREVMAAYNKALAADAGVKTTTRQLDSAREAYSVSRKLYSAGRATGTALLEAQFALAQARFQHLNARVDARLARAELDHALGRDARALAGPR